MRFLFFFNKQNTFPTEVSTRYWFYLLLWYRNSRCVCQRTRHVSEMTLADREWEGHLLSKLGNVFRWWKYYILLSVGRVTVCVREGISSNSLNPRGVSWNILQWRGADPITKAWGYADFCSCCSAVVQGGQNNRFRPNSWGTLLIFPEFPQGQLRSF